MRFVWLGLLKKFKIRNIEKKMKITLGTSFFLICILSHKLKYGLNDLYAKIWNNTLPSSSGEMCN